MPVFCLNIYFKLYLLLIQSNTGLYQQRIFSNLLSHKHDILNFFYTRVAERIRSYYGTNFTHVHKKIILKCTVRERTVTVLMVRNRKLKKEK